LVRRGLISVDSDPFKALRLKYKESKRKFLYPDEIEAICHLELDDNSLIGKVRLIFLFCFETGLRIGDALFLKTKDFNGEYIQYYCQKSDGYETLPLTKEAQRILTLTLNSSTGGTFIFSFIEENRLFDDLSILNEKKRKTALINKYLKEIAKRSKITVSLSSHQARHTMAVNALCKGLSYAEIKALLNHSDVKTTQLYAQAYDAVKVNAIKKLEQ
jgi:integrase